MSRENVLITGGMGFVGSNLWQYILNSEMLLDTYAFYRVGTKHGDLTNPIAVGKLFDKIKPKYVIHLAAMCGGIGANQLYPAVFWHDNLLMSMMVMKACVVNKVKKIITLGTVCSYGRNAKPPFKETDLYTELPEITNRAYGVAKYAIYEGLRAYNTEFDLPFSYLIPTNMYGRFDNTGAQNSHVIPAMMVAMHTAKVNKLPEVKLWGDGTATRDFLHATDAVRAIIACLDAETGNLPINLGTGEEYSMKGLAEMMASVVGFKGEIVWDASKPNGQPRRSVDYTRAKETLFWEPEIKLIDGLKDVYDWYCEPPPAPKEKPKAKPTEDEE